MKTYSITLCYASKKLNDFSYTVCNIVSGDCLDGAVEYVLKTALDSEPLKTYNAFLVEAKEVEYVDCEATDVV